jgi:hypothetical protein
MTQSKPEARASLLSELLLYHAVLGRGYISPFPATKGLVFSSALPIEALSTLASAETSFRRWHDQETEKDRQALEMLEETPAAVASVMGQDKLAGKRLKEKLSRRPHITWKEDQVTKSTLVELMKTHYYGAMTYVDAVGSRLAAALCNHMRLASDLGWVTLTEGTTDETLIRANASGGACIHSLAGMEAIFNHFCSCKVPQLERLVDRIKRSESGQVGAGTTVVIKGYPGEFSGISSTTLYSLTRRVFASGEKEVEKRTKVVFEAGCDSDWRQFLSWTLRDLIDEDVPSDWQWKLSLEAPTSPRTAVLFGARAAMVMAFIQTAEAQPDGPLRVVELRADHLQSAKAMAKMIYLDASGQEGREKRIKNLKPAQENFITPQKLAIARVAITEAIEAAPNRRVSRNQIRRDIAGVTLGLLDELVKNGDIIELTGTDECQMGRTTKAYVLPKDAPRCDEVDALDEFQEALEHFADHPDAFLTGEALVIVRRLRERAEELNREHLLPVVPLSRMTKAERRMLPKVLDLFPTSFLLRGEALEIPEPEKLMADEDVPLDRGANLWVRHKLDGSEFCDWDRAGLLKLADHWGSAAVVVPED